VNNAVSDGRYDFEWTIILSNLWTHGVEMIARRVPFESVESSDGSSIIQDSSATVDRDVFLCGHFSNVEVMFDSKFQLLC
jgi:hypothetical protein